MTEQNAESFRFQNPFGRFVRAEITIAWDLIKGIWGKSWCRRWPSCQQSPK
jgi:hypothetical protein